MGEKYYVKGWVDRKTVGERPPVPGASGGGKYDSDLKQKAGKNWAIPGAKKKLGQRR